MYGKTKTRKDNNSLEFRFFFSQFSKQIDGHDYVAVDCPNKTNPYPNNCLKDFLRVVCVTAIFLVRLLLL